MTRPTDTIPAPPSPPHEAPHAAHKAKSDRLAREAAALRANLRKRKDQARERAASDGETAPENAAEPE